MDGREPTFSEALLASLKEQRANLLANGQKPLCDVILRCGGIATQAHSSILASVSKYFERILTDRQSGLQPIPSSSLVAIDVTKLFRGIESLFPIVIDSLYTGVQVVSPQELTNSLLNLVYTNLELQLPFTRPHIEQQPVIINPDLQSKENLKDASMNFSLCPHCNVLFASQEEFSSHTKNKCTRKLSCYTCGKLFNRVQALALHLTEIRHGETVCSVCGYEGESQKEAENHINKHAMDQEKPYFCVLCDARFTTRKRWEKHMPKHSTEAPFICTDCGKGFKWKHALTAHSVIHSSVKKFLCQECGFSTSHVSTFKFHNRIHSGNLMKCDIKNCTFQTTRKSNLVQHKLTHSKEKPHQCEICGRAFSLAKNMRRHARQHDTNATIFKCKEPSCIFKTLRSDKYIEHMKKYHPEVNNRVLLTPLIKTENSNISKPTLSNNANSSIIKAEKNSSCNDKDNLLTPSPFNAVSPPNKTVSDTFAMPDDPLMDEGQFDDDLILAAAGVT